VNGRFPSTNVPMEWPERDERSTITDERSIFDRSS
jgi:hypothetical protein